MDNTNPINTRPRNPKHHRTATRNVEYCKENPSRKDAPKAEREKLTTDLTKID